VKYYTGLFALTQYVDKNESSVGIADEYDTYYPDKENYLRDSEGTILGDYGIFEVDLLPYGGRVCCANHKRAYLDLLLDNDFDTLTELFDYAIKDFDVIHEVFQICSQKQLYTKERTQFFNNEFGSNFRSYLLFINEGKVLNFLVGDD